MRTSWLLIALLTAFSANGQGQNPFQSLQFDKIVLYDYEPTTENPGLVDAKGKLVASAKIKKQVQLPAATSMALTSRLGERTSYGQASSFCFDPHAGIVYYRQGKIVRYVLVCLDCNTIRADVEIPAQQQLKQGQGAQAYYLGDGMSKSFRHFLNGLLKQYNFSHQLQSNSSFD